MANYKQRRTHPLTVLPKLILDRIPPFISFADPRFPHGGFQALAPVFVFDGEARVAEVLTLAFHLVDRRHLPETRHHLGGESLVRLILPRRRPEVALSGL